MLFIKMVCLNVGLAGYTHDEGSFAREMGSDDLAKKGC
jgi:hypothetical protein